MEKTGSNVAAAAGCDRPGPRSENGRSDFKIAEGLRPYRSLRQRLQELVCLAGVGVAAGEGCGRPGPRSENGRSDFKIAEGLRPYRSLRQRLQELVCLAGVGVAAGEGCDKARAAFGERPQRLQDR
ncbi:hypothetical protein C4K22_1527 [Pseudomonas chlororaphis subsp. aurantiaca]|nr:hypothetical protein C4K22_1527 [Pseudomonas chlororaphis subsp. aurantiaca]AZD40620.1 hypothetical protein C4K21_1531 [Pseudomonas chlororaphis subsp. aurantiaca]AZD59476.1 Indole-3-glycerol phosphate synthase [Pseudomonas chlororaphis subsp. aurantiaca]